ncbi:MAG: EAL domain-containing protein [Pseudomonadota bacterium]
MPRLSFRHKILLLLVTCMCLAQLITMLATLATTESTVRQSVNEDLLVAERTFDQLFEQRFYQLSESVQVLVDDFGFRSALASQDTPTIVSALENHAQRANASIAVFLDLDATISASTLATGSWTQQESWLNLVEGIQQEDYMLATLALDSAYYQIVVVPAMAPAKIGWVLMGFRLDDTLAADFRDITGLHISFYDPARPELTDITSTLSPLLEQQLLEELRDNGMFAVEGDGASAMQLSDESYLTRLHLLTGSSNPLFAVLQKSLEQEMQPYHALEKQLVMMFVVVLMVAVLAGTFIGGNIIAPVRDLAAQAERIGAGNYAVNIQINSTDEIGQLGTTLNTMQQEISRREYRILHQTQHDDLTDLPNRYLVQDRIASTISRAERGLGKFTVVMLDISRFKQVNDTLGHHIGDVLLKETANRLLRRQRKCDTVARMGGDDFLLLLENTDIETSLHLVKTEVLPLLTSPHQLENVEINVKFNCGFVEYPTHGESATSLLRRCEIALYEAKALHTGIAIYEQGRDESHRRELAIVSDIDKAMQDNQLRLYFQPQLKIATGEITQAEALVRWVHPTFGFLPPDEFISILEQTGNINKLTQWVLNETARQCSIWLERGIDLTIAVNLSALDLMEPALLEQINHVVQTHNIRPRHLMLEITESAVMQDPKAASSILRQLQQSGYRIAIDDFGTGYSSLAQLKSLPVGELKIDKSFVLHLTPSSQDSVIVKSTIELAHSMNLEVVAEGVETEQGLQMLRTFGCDTAQGYFISKPMAAADFEAWHKQNRERFLVLKQAAA